jgi:hypothetical protein
LKNIENYLTTFKTLYEAKEWREKFDGSKESLITHLEVSHHVTLKEV